MRQNKFIWIFTSIFYGLIITGCLKVGEDDPSISFRTRKARITGKWKVTNAVYSSRFDRMPMRSITNINFDNGKFTYNYYNEDMVRNKTTIDTSGSYTWIIDFEKSGAYKNLLTINGAKRIVNGEWYMHDSKDMINISSIEQVVDASFFSSLTSIFYQGDYYIKELRNDKIVLFTKNEPTTFYNNIDVVLEPA